MTTLTLQSLKLKTFLILFLLTSISFVSQAFNNKTYGLKALESKMVSKSELPPISHYIISGSVGAGAVVSSDIVNTGAVLPATLEFLLQMKRTRYGIGVTNELYLTPKNLGLLILGNSSNTTKYYFVMEQTIFKNSPFNLGWSGQIGGFLVGKERENQTSNAKGSWFVNLGVLVEIGHPRFFLFVRPALEYKSYSNWWHKEILATACVGLRWKIRYNEQTSTKK